MTGRSKISLYLINNIVLSPFLCNEWVRALFQLSWIFLVCFIKCALIVFGSLIWKSLLQFCFYPDASLFWSLLIYSSLSSVVEFGLLILSMLWWKINQKYGAVQKVLKIFCKFPCILHVCYIFLIVWLQITIFIFKAKANWLVAS